MPDDPLLALQALVEDELVALGRVAQEMEELLAASSKPPTRTELRAVAGMLHEFYNGVERIFERIAVSSPRRSMKRYTPTLLSGSVQP